MRIIIAPDSFTGTLTAEQAAKAIRDGWQMTDPTAEFWLVPMSDGGPGFISALQVALAGEIKEIEVENLIGKKIKAPILFKDEICFIESAKVVGPEFLEGDLPAPLTYSSYGIGELIKYAAQQGAKKIVVGVGGTASIDGGEGLLRAVFEGEIDLKNPPDWIRKVELVAATDVEVPLLGPRGAVRGFGKQKGLNEDDFQSAELILEEKTKQFGRRFDGKDPSLILGAGAGGGIGYGLLALGAKRESGLQIVFEVTNFEDKLSEADLLVTGEGSLDWQTLTGKVIVGLAQKAQKYGVATIAMAGRVLAGKRELAAAGIVGAYGCVEADEPVPSDAYESLRALAERLSKTWSA